MARNDGYSDTPARTRGTRVGGATEEELEFERPLRLDDEPDARLLDLEPDEESPFLRAQRRVPVRRGPIGRRAANRLKTATVVLALAGVAGLFAYALYHYGAHSRSEERRVGKECRL